MEIGLVMPKLHSKNGEKGGIVKLSATNIKQLNHISTAKQLLHYCNKIKIKCTNDHHNKRVNVYCPSNNLCS